MKALLEINELEVSLKKNRRATGEDSVILRDIDLTIYEGDLVGIVGESGSGKTTLLHSIASFLKEDTYRESGYLIFDGNNMLELSRDTRRRLSVERMGFILQDSMNSLNPYETIGSQLVESYTFKGWRHKEEALIVIKERLRKIGLQESLLSAYPYELSGGMKQRVAILLALASPHISILLADEPTTGLDVLNQYNFVKLLKEICQEQLMTLLYVTHDIRVLKHICDKVIVMKEGIIVESAIMEQLINEPQHVYTKELIKAAKYEG